MTNLTPKQEAFCQKYVETSSATAAYRLAYNSKNMKPEVIHVKACELLKDGKVAVRVAELRERLVKRHDVTVDSLVSELDELRDLARDDKQYSPAISAVMGKAKITGHITDQVKATVSVAPLPENDKAILTEYVKAD